MKSTKMIAGLAPLLGAALLLAACGGEAGEPGADGATAEGSADSTGSTGAGSGSAARLTPGLYESNFEFVEIEFDESQVPADQRAFVAGMLNEMIGEVRTTSQCITQEEIDRPRGEMFSGNEEASCEYDRFEMGGGSVDLAMSCSDPNSGTAEFEGNGTYTADSYEMTMTVQMGASSMGAMSITASSRGRRVGDCPAE